MATKITLTIPDKLFQQAESLAKTTKRSVADVLTESIVLTDKPDNAAQSAELDDIIEQERAAYLAMHTQLLAQYQGKYVAIYQGALIDHDADFAALYRRIETQYPDEFVLIRQVEPQPERIYHFRSPRWDRSE